MSIIGAHALFYTAEAEALRATLRDVFEFPHVDAGDGWLIFRLPPAELGVHPAEGPTFKGGVRHQLTFMCDDIHATLSDLRAKGITVQGEPEEEDFGDTVMLTLPGNLEVMLYEPRHAMAIDPAAAPLRPAVAGILREIAKGPSPDAAYLLNRADGGLLASLEALSAEAASAQPGGRSSVAAHADHLRYGLSLLNRWARGDSPWENVNWTESWERQRVTDEEWQALRVALAAELESWMAAVNRPWPTEPTATREIVGSLAHLAYHLGAIRQLASAAAGPKATD